jgi:hypothetical protein
MWPFSTAPHLVAIREHVAQRDRLLQKNTLASSGDKDAEILAADIAAMVAGVQAGKWTATELLEAFIRSTRRAQRRTNCVTEVAFDSALQRAAELDAEFEQTGKLRGPLHGVPFSLKGESVRAGGDDAVCSTPCALCVLMHDTHTDCYHLEGTHLTIGFSSWLKNGRSTEVRVRAPSSSSRLCAPWLTTLAKRPVRCHCASGRGARRRLLRADQRAADDDCHRFAQPALRTDWQPVAAAARGGRQQWRRSCSACR